MQYSLVVAPPEGADDGEEERMFRWAIFSCRCPPRRGLLMVRRKEGRKEEVGGEQFIFVDGAECLVKVKQ